MSCACTCPFTNDCAETRQIPYTLCPVDPTATHPAPTTITELGVPSRSISYSAPSDNISPVQPVPSPYRYCTFCPPLFSIFACLLLPAASGCGTPAASVNPPLIPVYVVQAAYTEYSGMTPQSHHAVSPTTAARNTVPYVQYTISHMYSVKPLASRSSPARWTVPSGR